MSVLVLCPTRDRPDDALAMATTVLATSKARVAFYVDDDQADMYDALFKFSSDTDYRITVTTGDRIGLCAAYNELAKNWSADIYGLGIDDSRYLTPDWDMWVEQTINSFPGRIGVAAVTREDLEHAQFAFVSREWINTVGWFAPPCLDHFCPDGALQLLGEETDIVWAKPTECCIHHDARPSIEPHKLASDMQALVMWAVTDKRKVVIRLKAARIAAGIAARFP